MTMPGRSAILLTFDGCMGSMGATGISLLILDVDGVLTVGRAAVGVDADSSRRFHVHDGCAIKLWRRCDGRVAILSGKSGNDITARAKELNVDWIETNATDKETAYNDILARAACDDDAVAYVGDDLPDLKPMVRCGFAVAQSACPIDCWCRYPMARRSTRHPVPGHCPGRAAGTCWRYR